MKNFFKDLLIGVSMGVVSVIPGISGGTMALITGVFDTLVDALGRLTSRKTWRPLLRGRFGEFAAALPWRFLGTLLAGLLAGTAAAAKVVTPLFKTHPTATRAFFLGLVAAALVPVARRVKRWNTAGAALFLAGALAGFYVVTRELDKTPDDWWMLVATGAVSACAMVLPGVSGAFALMLLGKFETMWDAFNRVAAGRAGGGDLMTLGWIVLGGALGLALFSHPLMYLLRRRHDATLAFLTGLMVVSLWTLWPWQPEVQKFVASYDADEIIREEIVRKVVWPWQLQPPAAARDYLLVLGAFVLGGAFVWGVERFAKGLPPHDDAA